jgi:hypothetical protein
VEDWQGAAILLREEGGTAARENRCAGRLRSRTPSTACRRQIHRKSKDATVRPFPERHDAFGTTAADDGQRRDNITTWPMIADKRGPTSSDWRSVSRNVVTVNQVQRSAAHNARSRGRTSCARGVGLWLV